MTVWHHPSAGYRLTDDRAAVDVDLVHGVLRETYWAKGIPRDTVAHSIAHSLCLALFHGAEQAGFARAITDYATTAYVSDVFVLPAHRGRGLGRWMMETMLGHPELQGFRRWMLVTEDAHPLYRKLGFWPVAEPQNVMERVNPDPYGAEK